MLRCLAAFVLALAVVTADLSPAAAVTWADVNDLKDEAGDLADQRKELESQLDALADDKSEALKRKEKGQRSTADAIEAVPHTLPALWRAEKIQSKTAKAGFDWSSALQALDKLEEEVRELRAALESGQIPDAPHGVREELGDTLFMAAKVAQMSGMDPEDALHRACDKFDRRFRAVEETADKPLAQCTEEELRALWEAAKTHDPS